MSQYIDRLFSFLHTYGEEASAFLEIGNLIDTYLANNSYKVEGLPDLLKNLRSGHPKLVIYDQRIVNGLLDAIVGMLNNDDSVDILISKFSQPNPPRYHIAQLLGWCGPRAQPALPTLIDLAVCFEHPITRIARQAVLTIGGAETAIFTAIHESIAKEDDFEFGNLTHLAELAGYNNHRGFLELIRLGAQSKNSDVRDVAAYTIGNMNSSSKQQMMDVLEKLRNDPDQDVRFSATEAMGNPS